MKRKVPFAILLLGILFSLGLTGCGTLTEDENESALPQALPAPWESQVPGMPTSPG